MALSTDMAGARGVLPNPSWGIKDDLTKEVMLGLSLQGCVRVSTGPEQRVFKAKDRACVPGHTRKSLSSSAFLKTCVLEFLPTLIGYNLHLHMANISLFRTVFYVVCFSIFLFLTDLFKFKLVHIQCRVGFRRTQ